MKSLADFQVPNSGEVTICELEGRVISMKYEHANISACTNLLDDYPTISIFPDTIHPHGVKDDARTLFLPVDEPVLKRFMQAYYEQGLTDALHIAADHGPFIIKKGAGLALTILKFMNSVHTFLNYNSRKDFRIVIEELSQTRLWSQSPIRCFSWHSNRTKIAVASSDDSVRIFSNNTSLVPLLKCRQQRNITCLAWRPLSNLEIAVGCESGILVWSLEPHSIVTRPSINNAIVLYRIEHTPVVSLAWNLQGEYLASASAYDSSILIWNVELNETSSLKKPGSYGNCLLRWSPNGFKLFSATMGVVFRVWECQTWQAERWSVLSGRIQTACWSPCSTMLLFTYTEEPILYALSFVHTDLIFAKTSKNSPNKAIPIYDFTRVDIDGVIVGGIVQTINWDRKGDYMAVLFRDSNYVAVFKVKIHPVLQINAGYVIGGLPGEKPVALEFQKNFEYGACLTIGWTSGRIQYFPIIYTTCHNTSINNRSFSSADIFQSPTSASFY